jgi:hypothetical protein
MLRTCRKTILGSLVSMLLVVGPALGQGTAPGKNPTDERGPGSATEKITFSSRDLETIRVYYQAILTKTPRAPGGHTNPAPPPVPVEKNAWLPPQYARRLAKFPADLESRLPRLPDNYVRGSIDADILIMDKRTRRVVAIAHDFLRL